MAVSNNNVTVNENGAFINPGLRLEDMRNLMLPKQFLQHGGILYYNQNGPAEFWQGDILANQYLCVNNSRLEWGVPQDLITQANLADGILNSNNVQTNKVTKIKSEQFENKTFNAAKFNSSFNQTLSVEKVSTDLFENSQGLSPVLELKHTDIDINISRSNISVLDNCTADIANITSFVGHPGGILESNIVVDCIYQNNTIKASQTGSATSFATTTEEVFSLIWSTLPAVSVPKQGFYLNIVWDYIPEIGRTPNITAYDLSFNPAQTVNTCRYNIGVLIAIPMSEWTALKNKGIYVMDCNFIWKGIMQYGNYGPTLSNTTNHPIRILSPFKANGTGGTNSGGSSSNGSGGNYVLQPM